MAIRGPRDGVGVAALARVPGLGDVPRVAAALRAPSRLRQALPTTLLQRSTGAAVYAAQPDYGR